MNDYAAFYKSKRIDVQAESAYEAQKKAASLFKARKSYDVTVVLAAKDGVSITHTADN